MGSSNDTTLTFQQLIDDGVLEIGDGYRAKNNELGGTGPIFLRAGHVTDSHIDFEGVEKFHSIDFDKLGPKMARIGDTIITTKGNSTGRTSFVTDRMPHFVYSPHLSYWRSKDKNRIASGFLRYWSRSNEFQSQLMGMKTSTDMAPYLSLTDQKRLKITLRPIIEQRAIANILGSLDDKIELNRRMNETLEAMAQALFKSWFVDFDPVIDNAIVAGNPIPEELADRAEVRRTALAEGTANRVAAKPFPAGFQHSEELGWIPEGWEIAALSDLLEVKYGKDHKKLNDGPIPVYGSGGLMRNADSSLYAGESVLIPRKGTLSNIMYLDVEFWTVDTMFYTIPRVENVAKYAFYHLKTLDFDSMNVGSAVPSMTTQVLNQLPVVLPSDSVREKFDGVLTSYFQKKAKCDLQSSNLTHIRDTLLPKLISGELRIPDAEKLADAVLA